MGTVTHLPQRTIKAVRVSDDITRITRFPKGADAHVKREFAQTLVQALDDLGVTPGDDFVVAAYQDELKPGPGHSDEDVAKAVEKAEDDAHRERDGEAIAVLFAVYDYQLGTLTLDELVERIRLTLRKVIQDQDAGMHAALGLGNTGRLGG